MIAITIISASVAYLLIAGVVWKIVHAKEEFCDSFCSVSGMFWPVTLPVMIGALVAHRIIVRHKG